MKKNEKDDIRTCFDDACDNYFNALSKGENKSILKKLFEKMILFFEKDGGLLQLFPSDIYINNDIVDLDKAKKILSKDLYKLVESLSNQLEGNNDYVDNENNAPYINYDAFHQACTNVALNFAMLTGTTSFINSKYLQGLEKKVFNKDLEYMKNSSKLVQDRMVYSSQWRILFRHYMKDVYDLYTEDWLGSIEFADYEDYEKILYDIISNSSYIEDEVNIDKDTHKYLTKYGLKNYYPFPKNRR